MFKDFNGWNIEKQKLDASTRIVYPKPREIWYIKIGINIGKEIYGKEGFARPVLVISRVGNMYFCVALSTKSTNVKYNIPIVFGRSSRNSYVRVGQGRVYDSLRFYTKIGILSKEDFANTKNLLREFYFPKDV